MIADNAHVDGQGKLYIMGEFRYLTAAKFPAFHPKLALVLRISAPMVEVRGMKANLHLEVVDEDGSELLPKTPEFEIEFAPVGPADRGVAHAQIVMDLNGMPIPKAGDLTFHVWVNGSRIGQVSMHAVKQDAAGAPGAPGAAG
ncbi:MAG: hypothetical protein U0974_03855 [Gemmatimonadales bacterium]|nr:hypothetical protein [Gemmatimonadales bacterium]MDZ4388848.1 hypothetical protein [Gemmatimonadales bacterium]